MKGFGFETLVLPSSPSDKEYDQGKVTIHLQLNSPYMEMAVFAPLPQRIIVTTDTLEALSKYKVLFTYNLLTTFVLIEIRLCH